MTQMTNLTPILVVDQLTKQFGNFVAVAGISFTVKKGEIVGLLGPNGAGKTTTMAMLLGVTTPTAGSVSIFGKDIQKERSVIAEHMNYSSAYTKVPWRLTVWEYLYVFAQLYGVKNVEKQIDTMLAIFRLQEQKNVLAGDLSAGNMARVNLAKAFINDPLLVLLDEPTSSMDPDIADNVRQFILKVQEEQQTTVLVTSHNMEEIEELCDRVIFINKGTIVAEGTPEELARSIDTTKVKLLMRDGQKRTIAYCQMHKLVYEVRERSVVIRCKEAQVAQLLHGLAKAGVTYSEITIHKPTLEDFFIEESR